MSLQLKNVDLITSLLIYFNFLEGGNVNQWSKTNELLIGIKLPKTGNKKPAASSTIFIFSFLTISSYLNCTVNALFFIVESLFNIESLFTASMHTAICIENISLPPSSIAVV